MMEYGQYICVKAASAEQLSVCASFEPELRISLFSCFRDQDVYFSISVLEMAAFKLVAEAKTLLENLFITISARVARSCRAIRNRCFGVAVPSFPKVAKLFLTFKSFKL